MPILGTKTMQCASCEGAFEDGDEVLVFYLQSARPGEKSGLLGLYEHSQYPGDTEDYIHFRYSCIEKAFSPVDNPFLYDSIVSSIRKEVEADIREEVETELDIQDDLPQLYEEDPPLCIWCKRRDTVWVQYRLGGIFYFCPPCHKMWDDEENEVEIKT